MWVFSGERVEWREAEGKRENKRGMSSYRAYGLTLQASVRPLMMLPPPPPPSPIPPPSSFPPTIRLSTFHPAPALRPSQTFNMDTVNDAILDLTIDPAHAALQ